MNPNTEHQVWSEWIFEIHESGRRVSRAELAYNIAKWFRSGFGSVGKFQITKTTSGWRVRLIIENSNASDPHFLSSVSYQFKRYFLEPGWGPVAWAEVSARILSEEESKQQWVEIPLIGG